MNKYVIAYFFPILLILAGSVAFVFFIKNKVMKISKEVRSVNVQIIAEKEAIHILNAEYAFLTNPKRMKKLISKHLSLHEISKNQLIEDSEIQRHFDIDIQDYRVKLEQKNAEMLSVEDQQSIFNLQEQEAISDGGN
ncbi:MAG: hypothetical protein ACK5WS_05055 [Alphaproteobacteria bacterium]|jgi:hypothetical protein|nr:hypothetical protein [Candidatus Jidaibacter sp.]